jgi:hypothetical protein
MDPITISTVKSIRELLGATHLVLFAVDEEGNQHVATHGLTEADAKVAAQAGNNLKAALGWDSTLCKSQPLSRYCKNCAYWKVDWGMHCFNGWSGDGSEGYCRFEPTHVKTRMDNLCGFFSPKG